MSERVFFANFDGKGPDFSALECDSVFGSWSIGGSPIGAGRWRPTESNRASQDGRCAKVSSWDTEIIDTPLWLISPLIDVKKYDSLTLAADLYFEASDPGLVGEDILTISILTIEEKSTPDKPKKHEVFASHQVVATVGENVGQVIHGPQSWDLPPDANTSSFIQLAFCWKSAVGDDGRGQVQLDNIEITGELRPQEHTSSGVTSGP